MVQLASLTGETFGDAISDWAVAFVIIAIIAMLVFKQQIRNYIDSRSKRD